MDTSVPHVAAAILPLYIYIYTLQLKKKQNGTEDTG